MEINDLSPLKKTKKNKNYVKMMRYSFFLGEGGGKTHILESKVKLFRWNKKLKPVKHVHDKDNNQNDDNDYDIQFLAIFFFFF